MGTWGAALATSEVGIHLETDMTKITCCMNLGGDVSWLLERNLKVLSQICNFFIISAPKLDDRSEEILRDYVHYRFRKEEKWRSEVKDFNEMTKEAVRGGADWILFCDFDEIFAAHTLAEIRILLYKDYMEAHEDVDLFRFRRPWLWKSESFYRSDNPDKFYSHNTRSVLVRAQPGLKWGHPGGSIIRRVLRNYQFGHYHQYGRNPISGYKGRAVDTEIIQLHYSAVDWTRYVKKNMRWLAWNGHWLPNKNSDELFKKHYAMIDESQVKVKPVPREWLEYDFQVPALKIGVEV